MKEGYGGRGDVYPSLLRTEGKAPKGTPLAGAEHLLSLVCGKWASLLQLQSQLCPVGTGSCSSSEGGDYASLRGWGWILLGGSVLCVPAPQGCDCASVIDVETDTLKMASR